jgi:retron-type reverse transcriptase
MKFNDLYSIKCREDCIVKAITNLSVNTGSSTAGVDRKTLDGLDMKMVKTLQEKLKSGTFDFSAVLRIYIPKPGKKKNFRYSHIPG